MIVADLREKYGLITFGRSFQYTIDPIPSKPSFTRTENRLSQFRRRESSNSDLSHLINIL